jgi:uncharacterized membrane protein
MAGSSAMPHLGHAPGRGRTTSGCIGHVQEAPAFGSGGSRFPSRNVRAQDTLQNQNVRPSRSTLAAAAPGSTCMPQIGSVTRPVGGVDFTRESVAARYPPGPMSKGRLEAFSDGVIAILITIMVLELKPPHGDDLASLRSLVPALPAYALSFAYLGIYWNNHHHMLHVTRSIDGRVLWANLHLLFWLSLVPFMTEWVGESHFARLPTALYGAVLLLSGFAYRVLQGSIIRCEGGRSQLAASVGRDRKGLASVLLYLAAIPLAYVRPWLAVTIYVLVALMWFVPDRRIEAKLAREATPREPSAT